MYYNKLLNDLKQLRTIVLLSLPSEDVSTRKVEELIKGLWSTMFSCWYFPASRCGVVLPPASPHLVAPEYILMLLMCIINSGDVGEGRIFLFTIFFKGISS